jgi:hypothetical protein
MVQGWLPRILADTRSESADGWWLCLVGARAATIDLLALLAEQTRLPGR